MLARSENGGKPSSHAMRNGPPAGPDQADGGKGPERRHASGKGRTHNGGFGDRPEFAGQGSNERTGGDV